MSFKSFIVSVEQNVYLVCLLQINVRGFTIEFFYSKQSMELTQLLFCHLFAGVRSNRLEE